MKVLVDIKENKVEFVMELLKSLSLKVEEITPSKARFLGELKGSVKEVTLAKQGKIKLQSARRFLNDLHS